MHYLLILKKQQNLKLSSVACYRWRFKCLSANNCVQPCEMSLDPVQSRTTICTLSISFFKHFVSSFCKDLDFNCKIVQSWHFTFISSMIFILV